MLAYSHASMTYALTGQTVDQDVKFFKKRDCRCGWLPAAQKRQHRDRPVRKRYPIAIEVRHDQAQGENLWATAAPDGLIKCSCAKLLFKAVHV